MSDQPDEINADVATAKVKPKISKKVLFPAIIAGVAIVGCAITSIGKNFSSNSNALNEKINGVIEDVDCLPDEDILELDAGSHSCIPVFIEAFTQSAEALEIKEGPFTLHRELEITKNDVVDTSGIEGVQTCYQYSVAVVEAHAITHTTSTEKDGNMFTNAWDSTAGAWNDLTGLGEDTPTEAVDISTLNFSPIGGWVCSYKQG